MRNVAKYLASVAAASLLCLVSLAAEAGRPLAAEVGRTLAAEVGRTLAAEVEPGFAPQGSSAAYRDRSDPSAAYRDRSDSLQAAVFTSQAQGNYLSKGRDIRTEVISAAGLCKMACCNLAESFENSASVTVGYSDAVTGARQIRLLGLSGIYTQMLDENRPVMRGLAAPFGLSWVPGQWLESIQIAKGVTSVINGVESMTGQINMEHRKPTDEKPLFINASVMSDTKADFNAASSLQINEKWSTVVLGHASGNFVPMDSNRDGFLDDPMGMFFNLSNRWLYFDPSGMQIRFGVRALYDARKGGQYSTNSQQGAISTQGTDPLNSASRPGTIRPAYDRHSYNPLSLDTPWGSDIADQSYNAYFKIGVPLNEANTQNVAAVLDYTYNKQDAYFGGTSYLAGQHSAFLNLLYQNQDSDMHHFTAGISALTDIYFEELSRKLMLPYGPQTIEKSGGTDTSLLAQAGIFCEYTLHLEDKLTVIASLRGDWFKNEGFRATPRLTLKYAPLDEIVVRLNAGRGLRYSLPLVDNIGIFSTSKRFQGDVFDHMLEDAWTFGGNLTYYLPFGGQGKSYISMDFFRTQFTDQMVVDYDRNFSEIWLYRLKSLPSPQSFSNNFQLDFYCEPVRRLSITATFRYTDARQTYWNTGLVEKPMTSRYKGVLNIQYATNLNKWIFDFTASVNGPCRVYDFMTSYPQYADGVTPVYPLLYLQVTRRFKGVDLYIGGENLTNFKQKDPILGASDVRTPLFDASCIWGPITGIKAYAGVRFTLWKTEK
ncbi:MAG: TonB-dependent receptor plug domain-containing protein [Bacteroidales bacterium]|nr:TonB-dependent receptor plug domain-containing protein [Bacteroidales bacterium]